MKGTLRGQRLGFEFLWIGFGQALAALGFFAGVRLLTAALNPTEYGRLALALTVAVLAQQVLFGPLSGAFLRFYSAAREVGEGAAFLWSVGRLLRRTTFLLFLFGVLIGALLQALDRDQWLPLLVAGMVFAFLSSLEVTIESIQNAARQRALVAWHFGIGTWLRYLGGAGLCYFLRPSGALAMFGFSLGTLGSLASRSIFFHRQIGSIALLWRPSKSSSLWTKRMQTYAFPFMGWGLFTWAQIASDRWALQTFTTTHTVGLYNALYQIGYYPVLLISTAVAQLIMPVLFGWAGDGTDELRVERIRDITRNLVVASLILTLVAAVGTWLIHEQLFAVIASPEYGRVSYLMPLLILAGGLFATGQLAVTVPLANLDSRLLLTPKVLTALLGIVLNVGGAVWLGLKGVAISAVMFALTYCIWMLRLGWRSRLTGTRKTNVAVSAHAFET